MMKKRIQLMVRLVAAASLAAAMAACSGQQNSGQTGANNAVAMKFDLGQCQQLSPSLYKCPALDKPLCDPGYNKNDVICVKVDSTGVVIQQFQ